MKRIRLTEADLHRIVKETVNRVLKEDGRDIDDDNYFGGGLPDRYFDDDAPENDSISQGQISQLDNISGIITNIANNTNGDTELLFQAADCIDRYIDDNASENNSISHLFQADDSIDKFKW